jgi:hypothetical protein
MKRERPATVIVGALVAGIVAALLSLLPALLMMQTAHSKPRAEALCHTDSECMLLCDPDDPECDGGPQSAPEKVKTIWM